MGTVALFASAAAARIERNPAEIYLAGLSATGRRSMAQKLKIVAGILGYTDPRLVDWEKLQFEHVVAIRTSLSEGGLAPATVNATLAAIRGVRRRHGRLVCFPVKRTAGSPLSRDCGPRDCRAAEH
jgi:hypothetical protein